jgi:hypothetical protein
MRNLLANNGINAEIAEAMVAGLAAQGVEVITDINVLSDGELKSALTVEGSTLVMVKKAIKILKESVANIGQYNPVLPMLPEELTSPIDVKVTANIEADIPTMVRYINILNLHNLGIETIAKRLFDVVEQRFDTLEVGATTAQLEIFKTVAKFNSIDDSIYRALMEKLNMAGSLVDCRHDIINTGNNTFIPSLAVFVNDALDFGQTMGSTVSTEVVRRLFGLPKPGANINIEDLTLAVNSFVNTCNKGIKGLNTPVINATYELYHELYELLDSTDLHRFLGVNSRDELLRRLDINITPKQARAFKELPGAVFTLIAATQNQELRDPANLYAYLNTAWQTLRAIDIMGLLPADQKRAATAYTLPIM